jgi:hypothetical protein
VESIALWSLRQKFESRAHVYAVIKACWGRTGSRTSIVPPRIPHQVLLTTKQPLFSPHHSTAENEAKGNSRITRSVSCFILSHCTFLNICILSLSHSQCVCDTLNALMCTLEPFTPPLLAPSCYHITSSTPTSSLQNLFSLLQLLQYLALTASFSSSSSQ